MYFDWNVILPCAFLKTKMLSMVQYKWWIRISDQFSGVIVCHQKTDLKQPTLPCGLGLKTFCFSPDNVYWNSCIRLAQSILKCKFPFVDKPLRIKAPSDISPSKRAFERYKPWGLFSEFYANFSLIKELCFAQSPVFLDGTMHFSCHWTWLLFKITLNWSCGKAYVNSS